MFIDERFTAITPDGTGENGSWKGIPDPSGANRSETMTRSASYASAVYRRRRASDPYAASRFDGKKARGELDQIVLEHTLRNISYRKPKGRQPCDDKLSSTAIH
ncbi:jg22605 [Pararge aegeria aegeria]|uniref:Jg22605 protein n=1 Tax=Pararge aegeria aegeria TaxID=348720 RepID=A0A8S4SFB2_9NEOP|nr:jg22605 [Pararge aegeria aegeria]